MHFNVLENLGFSKNESDIYLTLIRHGELSAAEIAKKTKIGRTNVYDYTANLVQKGLLFEIEKNSRTYFGAEDPKHLQEIVNHRLQDSKQLAREIIDVMPELESMHKTTCLKPLIRFYSGLTGYTSLNEEIYFGQDHTEIYIFTKDLDDYALPEPQYRNAALRKSIFTYQITNSGKLISEFVLRDAKELRKTLQIHSDLLDISKDMIVFGDHICFGNISKDDFFVTRVTSDFLANFFKAVIQQAVT